MTTPRDTRPKLSLGLDKVLTTLEADLRATTGGTLLGEITLTEEQSDNLAYVIQELVTRYGASKATRFLINDFPFILAIWLVNEAFFHYISGSYWPTVLERIGIKDVSIYSVRLGRAFVNFLERRQLPRFHRLKTYWSYLGPILAHAGIPRSCLPEFFEKVLPRAEECDAAEDEAGFEQLLASLPSLYLTKPTERFLLYGRRSVLSALGSDPASCLIYQRKVGKKGVV